MRLSSIYESMDVSDGYEIISIEKLISRIRSNPKCFGVVGVDGRAWVANDYINPDDQRYDGPHEALMDAAGLSDDMDGARFLIHSGDLSVGPLGGKKSVLAVLAVLEKVGRAGILPVYWDALDLGGMAETRAEVMRAIQKIKAKFANPD